jgi:hypothetical protein
VTGLTGEQSDLRVRESIFGDNIIELTPKRGFIKLISETLDEFRLRILQILCVAHILVQYYTAKDD